VVGVELVNGAVIVPLLLVFFVYLFNTWATVKTSLGVIVTGFSVDLFPALSVP